MTNEAVFVAIGIACVVAVLLFMVFIIYCVKRQQEKERTRQQRLRQAREERLRRHLVRGNIVRPPPYDPNRQNLMLESEIPFSPPPAYKEVATPQPSLRQQVTSRHNTRAGGGSTDPGLTGTSRSVARAEAVVLGSSMNVPTPHGGHLDDAESHDSSSSRNSRTLSSSISTSSSNESNSRDNANRQVHTITVSSPTNDLERDGKEQAYATVHRSSNQDTAALVFNARHRNHVHERMVVGSDIFSINNQTILKNVVPAQRIVSRNSVLVPEIKDGIRLKSSAQLQELNVNSLQEGPIRMQTYTHNSGDVSGQRERNNNSINYPNDRLAYSSHLRAKVQTPETGRSSASGPDRNNNITRLSRANWSSPGEAAARQTSGSVLGDAGGLSSRVPEGSQRTLTRTNGVVHKHIRDIPNEIDELSMI